MVFINEQAISSGKKAWLSDNFLPDSNSKDKQGRGNKSVIIITDLMTLPYRRDRLKDIKGKSAGHRHVEQHKLHTLLYIAGQHLRLKNGGLVIGS